MIEWPALGSRAESVAAVNPLEAEDLPEWPWYVDPIFLIAVVIIGVAVWWVWSGRAPH
jgi:hypothetical protein